MPKGSTKRIPDNSVLILLKFPSPMHLESFLEDEEFYRMAGIVDYFLGKIKDILNFNYLYLKQI